MEIDPDRYEFCFSYDRNGSNGKLFICDHKSEDLCNWRTALCYGEYAEVTAFRDEIRQFVSDESDKLKSNTLEFKVPKMTQDFVSRFIRGRESINGFIHRNPEINIRISSRVFNTIQNPDDAFNFFKAAI
jgi:hypothetical protein